MEDKRELKDKEGSSVNLGRHQAQCTVCSSPYRQLIEECWIGWGNTQSIADRCGVTRYAVYRHGHAFNLFSKRRRNIAMALEKIIECVDCAPTTASTVLSAIKAYVKLNSQAEWKEQAQGTSPEELFERMSPQERDAFARDGSLPDWFSGAKGATPSDSQEGEKESQVTETKGLQ